MSSRFHAIHEQLAQMPLADTHEHLLEEDRRLVPGDRWRPNDIGVLFTHYMDSDLQVAGMPRAEMEEIFLHSTPPERKWQLIRPWWKLVRHTGCGLCVRESVSALFGHDDIHDGNWREIDEQLRASIRPGYYEDILLRVAHLDHAQVNSIEVYPFVETSQPDLLPQDISFPCMSTEPDLLLLERLTGKEIGTLAALDTAIDAVFERYGPQAIAIKNQSAYHRRLDYDDVPRTDAEPVFRRFLREGQTLSRRDRKPLEDYLFNGCVRRATAMGLPVKLHTGYYAGENWMPLERLRTNAGDMCRLCQLHPRARFVFMHITWPYQDEALAVAKHYANAWIDMCWAWIINPVAAGRFLEEFLLTAPLNKVFTFGGDFAPVELVPGHARIARRGIALALSRALDAGWLREEQLPQIIEALMFRNACTFFGRTPRHERPALSAPLPRA